MADRMGDLEEVVLLAVLRLDGDATAIRIRETIRDVAGRSVSRGALYATLERLDEKGLVGWQVGESVPDRGGIPRRCFRATAEGIDALRTRRDMRLALWEGIENALD